MRRRILISAVLALLLLGMQLLARNGFPAAVATAAIGFVVAFLVLLVSDRWFARNR